MKYASFSKRLFMITVLLMGVITYYPTQGRVSAEDIESPQVVESSPSPSSNGFSVTEAVYVVFDEDIQPSATFNLIALVSDAHSVNVTSATYGNQLIVSPDTTLDYSTTYSLQVPQDALQDLSGNALESPYTLFFTTMDSHLEAISFNPIQGDEFVPHDQQISITFNQIIYPGERFAEIGVQNGSIPYL